MKRKYKGPTPDDFNAAVPIGTEVRYFKRIPADEDDFEKDVTAGPAFELHGRTVVALEAHSGVVDAGHLMVRNPKRQIGGLVGWW